MKLFFFQLLSSYIYLSIFLIIYLSIYISIYLSIGDENPELDNWKHRYIKILQQSGTLRDKTKDDKLIYIPIYYKQNYVFGRLILNV